VTSRIENIVNISKSLIEQQRKNRKPYEQESGFPSIKDIVARFHKLQEEQAAKAKGPSLGRRSPPPISGESMEIGREVRSPLRSPTMVKFKTFLDGKEVFEQSHQEAKYKLKP
jgi:hypothetical protein